jgi:hypothetical protein
MARLMDVRAKDECGYLCELKRNRALITRHTKIYVTNLSVMSVFANPIRIVKQIRRFLTACQFTLSAFHVTQRHMTLKILPSEFP